MREKTRSSPALECGRIRTVLATSFIPLKLCLPFPSFSDDSYPQIPSNWMMISLHFPHLKALFGLHPRLSWECLHNLEADTPQTLLEASGFPVQ